MKNLLFSFILFITIFFSCKDRIEPKTNFHITRTNFYLLESEKKILEKSKSEKLYVTFYTIKLVKNKAVPFDVVVGENFPVNKKIIPVVKINDNVFKNLKYKNIDTLANRITQFNNQICKIKRIRPLEILLDFNFSVKTKDNYLYFTKKLSELTKQKISICIKPHHLKLNEKNISNNINGNIYIKLNNFNVIFKDLFNKNSLLNSTLKKESITNFIIPSQILYHKKNGKINLIPLEFLKLPEIETKKNLIKINPSLYLFKRTFKFNNSLISKKDSLILHPLNLNLKVKILKFLAQNYTPDEIIFEEIN